MDLQEAARKFADADGVFRRRLQSGIRSAANVAADRARERILAAESHHDGTLRAVIAGSVAVHSRVSGEAMSAAVSSEERRMPPEKLNLNAYANARNARWRRWRHPTFGHEPWVPQDWPSAAGWLDDAVLEAGPEVRRQIESALNDLARYLP